MSKEDPERTLREQRVIDEIAESRGEEFTGAYEVTDGGERVVADAAIRGGGGNQTPITDPPELLAIASDEEGLP